MPSLSGDGIITLLLGLPSLLIAILTFKEARRSRGQARGTLFHIDILLSHLTHEVRELDPIVFEELLARRPTPRYHISSTLSERACHVAWEQPPISAPTTLSISSGLPIRPSQAVLYSPRSSRPGGL